MLNAHKNRPENPADTVRKVSESARTGGGHVETVRALVVRIHVLPVLSAIRLETRINADTRASQHRGMPRGEKRCNSLDCF